MKAIVATLFLLANAAPFTMQQTAEVKRVEESLLAPCCYIQSIAQHGSPIAEQMRHEVTEMVASGESETEIIDHYKVLYGERILIVPGGRTGQVLFALPVVVFLACSGAVLLFLRKTMRRRTNSLPTTPVIEGGRTWDAIRAEIERETGEGL
ncbi:MAG: cytochrome c-type biogenesis protein CcmH [Candidatus Acidiferrum sp.]